MHNTIIQISAKPIDPADYLDYCILPEWFTEGIADYGGDEKTIEDLSEYFPFKKDGEAYTLDLPEVTIVFQKKHENIVKLAETLTKLTYSDMMDGRVQPAYSIEYEIEDRFGTYIYDEDTDDLMTYDRWLRYTFRNNPDVRFFVGATLDYHC